MEQIQLNTNYSRLLFLVLNEVRIEKRRPKGVFAQSVGKKPREWEKIEKGSVKLTIDDMFEMSNSIGEDFKTIVNIAHWLYPIFCRAGWFFHSVELGSGEDDLIKLMNKYYVSSRYNSIFFLTDMLYVDSWFLREGAHPNIVKYCCNPFFRENFDKSTPLVLAWNPQQSPAE